MDNNNIIFLNAKELAEKLKVVPGTLANWRVQGRGPKFVKGKPVLYSLAEVEAWIKRQTTQSTVG